MMLLGALLSCPGRAASQASATFDEERVRHLLEVIGTQAPSMPVPKEIEETRDRAVREAYWAQRNAAFEAFEAKMRAATDELAAMGDNAVDRLVGELNNPLAGAARRHRIIVVLAKIGTLKAQQELLKIALAEDRPARAHAFWAARNLVEIAPDKGQIISLLEADDERVISVALSHLPGVGIDSSVLSSMRRFLQANEYHPAVNLAIRTKAAIVLASDKSEVLLPERIIALVESIRTVDDMPQAADPFQDTGGTLADMMYHYHIDALTKMKGVDRYLRDATRELTGNARSVVIVARALRGDESVKHELRELLMDSQMTARTSLRYGAARALGYVGTKDDLPFLEQLSKEDPLEMVDFGGPVVAMVDGQYVNRGSDAAPAMPQEDPAWKRARRSYPIRGAALLAIRQIEERYQGDTGGSQKR